MRVDVRRDHVDRSPILPALQANGRNFQTNILCKHILKHDNQQVNYNNLCNGSSRGMHANSTDNFHHVERRIRISRK
jgi:hypothetical protein